MYCMSKRDVILLDRFCRIQLGCRMERVGRIVVGHTRNGGPDGVKLCELSYTYSG